MPEGRYWEHRVGIPIGNKTVYFQMHEGKPVIKSSKESLGGGVNEIIRHFQGVARMRAEFNRLPEPQRNAILEQSRNSIEKIEKKSNENWSANFKAVVEKGKQEHMTKFPEVNRQNVCKRALEDAKSALELDVAWEEHSQNIHLKEQFFELYKDRKEKLVQEGKIEPENLS